MKIDIGISDANREQLAGELSVLLADTFTLYLKTHNFHWNVSGPMFQVLHLMFEQQYNELWIATDAVAERIRTLGHHAPASYAAFGRLSSISDTDGAPPAKEMIKLLVEGHEALIRTARKIIPIANDAGDDSSADLATQRLQIHEKTAWMLRMMLEE